MNPWSHGRWPPSRVALLSLAVVLCGSARLEGQESSGLEPDEATAIIAVPRDVELHVAAREAWDTSGLGTSVEPSEGKNSYVLRGALIGASIGLVIATARGAEAYEWWAAVLGGLIAGIFAGGAVSD